MRKRMTSLLLTLVMLLSLVPAMGVTASAAGNPDPTAVSVNGGKRFSSSKLYYKNNAADCSYESTGYNAAYDPDTGTLTLNGYDGGRISLGGAAADHLTIKLIGDNKITVNGDEGIGANSSGGSITITADSSSNGTLTINVTSDNDGSDAAGINANFASGATCGDVKIKGYANVTINTTTKRGGYGIYAKKVAIEDHAKVATTVNAPSNAGGGLVFGIFAQDNVTIDTTGEITVDASNAGTGDKVYSTGVNSRGSLTLTQVGKMTVRWNSNVGISGYGAPLSPAEEFDSNAYDTHVDKSNKSNCVATYTPKGATPTTLTGISVKTAPSKVTYTEGDSFDKTGMVIEAAYSDSTKKDVTTYTYTPTGALTTSDTTISISYSEGGVTKTCTQTITVNAAPPTPATLTGISVKTAPSKVTYTEGDSFDKTGMVIEAAYSDSTKKDVTTYTYTPTGALTTSDTTISISYSEGGVTKTCTQTIAVNAAPTEYTITFDVNGGSGTILPQTTSGQKLSPLPTATRSGSYSFDGWYTAASGGTQITTAYVFSANTTVYAHWTYTGGGGGGGGGSYTPSYTVSVDKTENGTITVSPKSASKGDAVTITVKPDKGYELDTLKVLDKNGDKVKLTEKNGKYTFTMPTGKVTVKGSFVEEAPVQIFKDVPVDAYYYEAVKWAAEKGITGGVGNGLFGPNDPCTRAQIVTFLWRAAGSPAPKHMSSFADVPADAFYAKAVAWAVENGITGGTGDGKFSPDATCTRTQSVTFLYRAAGSPKVSGSAEFGDVATNAYYADAVAWAAKNGITGGIGGGLFGSNNDCTRAQIVTFLYRNYQSK